MKPTHGEAPADAGGRVSHTPGPWRTYQGGSPQYNDGVWYVCKSTEDRSEIASLGSSETDEANARLIAAAPELLEALRDCLGYVISDYEGRDGGFGGAQESVDRARAAIAKAEGK